MSAARESNTAVDGDLAPAEPAAADESHASSAQQPRAEAAQETKAAEPVEHSTAAVGVDPLEANLLALFAGLDADDNGEVSEATLADGLVRAGATAEEAKTLCTEIAAGGIGSVSRTAWAAVAKRVVGKKDREKEKVLAPLAMLARRPAGVAFEDVRQWREGLLTETVTVKYSGRMRRHEFVKLQMAIGEEEKEGGKRAQAECPGWPVFSRDPAATVEAGCSITKTEERGILLAQLVMVWMHIAKYCEAEGWADWQGNKLTSKKVSLYDLNTYLILPATMRKRCSYVEFVASRGEEAVLRCPAGHVRMDQNPALFMLEKFAPYSGLDQTCSECGSVQRPGAGEGG